MRKPKLLIIGHGRHGKDTVAEILRDTYGLSFKSSSEWAGLKAVWPMWGKDRYASFSDMYNDRHNYRQVWKNLIKAYNTPNLTKTSSGMLNEGFDIYVGMRDRDEFEASKHLFDEIVWVDADDRLPNTHTPEMELTKEDATWTVDNNMSEKDLPCSVHYLVEHLIAAELMEEPKTQTYRHAKQAYGKQTQLLPCATKKDEPVDLLTMPEGAINILDHGYIKLVDVNGSDADIAHAARMSYGRGTKQVSNEEGLIRYLYRNAHTSPFEMVGIKVQMRLPIFVMRQLVRQRTFRLNEYSGRYSIMPRLFYCPALAQICGQHQTNKQGSGDPLSRPRAKKARDIFFDTCNAAFDNYEDLLDLGVAREEARIVLPLSTYTETVVQMDLNNLLKFLWLRDDEHAQWEIRQYAQVISQFVKDNFPATYAAYERKRSSVTLTQKQLEVLFSGNGLPDLPKSEASFVEKLWEQYQV